MDADEKRKSLDALTHTIIGAAHRVSLELGFGFLEKVYENALRIELASIGHEVETQVPFDIRFKGQLVGHYAADMVVAGKILVEVKALDALATAHTAQCLNYLKASGISVCLLLNFGRAKLETKRVVHGF
ncbi:MAG: GxxExxY protein [Betaproteobacteria bacterium]|nr:GxxExxY protein [Betaproteobacteria bacterium]